MMNCLLIYLSFFIIYCTNTCCGKTECLSQAKIAVIINPHQKICSEPKNSYFSIPTRGNHTNAKPTYSFSVIEVGFFSLDACENSKGILRALFDAIAWINFDCLKPPFFLGFIGPNKLNDLSETLKLTHSLKIPHIVSIPSTFPQVYSLHVRDQQPIIQGIFKLLELLRWKAFNLNINSDSPFFQNIGKEIFKISVEKKLCARGKEGFFPRVLQVGEPEKNFFRNYNESFIIIISDENYEKEIKDLNTTNTYLLIQNMKPTEEKVGINHQQFNQIIQKIQVVNLKEQQFLQNAMEIYMKTLASACEKDCISPSDYTEWNSRLSKKVKSFSLVDSAEMGYLSLKMIGKYDSIQSDGKIFINNENIKILWNNQMIDSNYFIQHGSNTSGLKNFYFSGNINEDCSKNSYNSVIIDELETAIEDKKSSKINISEFEDTEWWTMVTSVAGVGIVMFSVGFFAVYIVYTNVRGPKSTNNIKKSNNFRNFSIQRVDSEKQSRSVSTNSSKILKKFEREDSRNSIKSNISEKSV